MLIMKDYKYTVLSSDGTEFGLFINVGQAEIMCVALKEKFNFLSFSVVKVSDYR